MTLFTLRPRHVRYLISLNMEWTAFSLYISQAHPESAKVMLGVYDRILQEKNARVRIRPGLDDVCSVCKDKRAECNNIETEEAELIGLLGFSAGDNSYSIDEILAHGHENES